MKLSDIGSQIALSESAVSKYLIAPKLEKNFSNEEDLKKNSKVILTLEYALKISEAMGAKLWNILHMYEEDREEIEKCTNLNASPFANDLNFYYGFI